MKNEIILPFEDSPYTLMYHYMAFSMGIIQANAQKDIQPWLCGKYINCNFSFERINQFNISLDDNWSDREGVLFRQTVELSKDLYEAFFEDDVSFLCQMIDDGNYINGVYNEQYIPGKAAFQKSYFYHDFLLIGYDHKKRLFKSIGYLSDRKYKYFYIPYDNFLKAIKTLQCPNYLFNFFSFNHSFDFSLNLPKIIHETESYLKSTFSNDSYTVGDYFGIEAIKALSDYFLQSASTYQYIDVRYTRGLMEQKMLSDKRIKYLDSIGVNISNDEIQISEEVFMLSKKIHLLGIKYSFDHCFRTAKSMCDLINKTIELEQQYLPIVVKKIKDVTNVRI